MRTLLVALAALGLAAASPSFAQQDHGDHKAAAEPTVSVKDPANPTHEECKGVMGRKMDGRVLHDHSAEKGAPKPPVTKPLNKAEMEKMHAKCAAKMPAAK